MEKLKGIDILLSVKDLERKGGRVAREIECHVRRC